MGYRDRPSLSNLLRKQWDDTPITAQHIPKSDHCKFRSPSPIQTLHQIFGHPFRGAHDTRGIHRLVGGNEHKSIDPPRQRHLRHSLRPEHVIANGLFGIQFHERHMFVRGSMKDKVRVRLL